MIGSAPRQTRASRPRRGKSLCMLSFFAKIVIETWPGWWCSKSYPQNQRNPPLVDSNKWETSLLTVHKPRHLERGALIGVVAPAGNVEPERLRAGVEAIRAQGFEVELAANLFASKGYLAGDARQRADD